MALRWQTSTVLTRICSRTHALTTVNSYPVLTVLRGTRQVDRDGGRAHTTPDAYPVRRAAARRSGQGMGAPTLAIRLFGALDLRLGEVALPPLDSARAESLLAYLLLHREAPQARQRLAFLLWPDSTEAQARTN